MLRFIAVLHIVLFAGFTSTAHAELVNLDFAQFADAIPDRRISPPTDCNLTYVKRSFFLRRKTVLPVPKIQDAAELYFDKGINLPSMNSILLDCGGGAFEFMKLRIQARRSAHAVSDWVVKEFPSFFGNIGDGVIARSFFTFDLASTKHLRGVEFFLCDKSAIYLVTSDQGRSDDNKEITCTYRGVQVLMRITSAEKTEPVSCKMQILAEGEVVTSSGEPVRYFVYTYTPFDHAICSKFIGSDGELNDIQDFIPYLESHIAVLSSMDILKFD